MVYRRQKIIILVTFLTVPLLLLCTLSLYPAGMLLYQSFTSWNGYAPVKEWVGLANYRQIFTDGELFEALSHNAVYVLGGLVQNALALYFAVVLNTKLKGSNAFRVLLFLPYIINAVATAYMFTYVFDTNNGALNLILLNVGIISEPISWLGNKAIVNFTLVSIAVWKYMGFNMVIYLGALQSIPSDLYEAAKIDGAGPIQQFRYITLPSIMLIVELSLFLTIAGALEAFDLPFILTNGGPNGASATFLTNTVETAFKYSNFGLASAMAVVLLLMIAIIVPLQRLIVYRGDRKDGAN